MRNRVTLSTGARQLAFVVHRIPNVLRLGVTLGIEVEGTLLGFFAAKSSGPGTCAMNLLTKQDDELFEFGEEAFRSFTRLPYFHHVRHDGDVDVFDHTFQLLSEEA